MTEIDDRHWHLSKTVNVSHILTTFAMFISALVYVNGLDKRLSEQAVQIQYLQAKQDSEEQRNERKFQEIKVDLREINAKLDRLVDKLSGH